MRIHAIKTGNVLLKSTFLGSPATAGILPYMAHLHLDHSHITLPIFAWVIEHPEGVIIIDTGVNAATKQNFMIQARFEVSPDEEIGAQLTQLGISPKDIAKVVLTHLHGDHVEGLKDFENASIWIGEQEYSPFQSSKNGVLNKLGVRLPTWLNPNLITFRGDPVGLFEYSFPLTKDGTVFAVPTPGHTAGHLSVIVKADGVNYFIAGDVTYYEHSLTSQTLEGPSMKVDLHRQTLQRVRAYTEQYPTVYLPSHDPEAAPRLAAQQTVENAIFSH